MSAGPWIIELGRDRQGSVYRTTLRGTGGETRSLAAAQRYTRKEGAEAGLRAARKRRPYPIARIRHVDDAAGDVAVLAVWRRQQLIDMLRRMLHLWETNARPSQGEADAMKAALDKMQGEP